MARRKNPTPEPVKRVRCAIYTRKSTDEGLDQAFNSLDAQRESCEAYIQSQMHAGWVALSDRYDDPAYSGGNLARPALQRLLRDIEAGRVDSVVLYRVDRLTRSIIDFARLIEVFERHGVIFVSVTEQFSTATPTGRLQLHMILSFAQYEREVAAERIRDKIRLAKARGKHMGGPEVLGYDAADGRLTVNRDEARLVHHIFTRFTRLGSATKLAAELNAQGHTTKTWTTRGGKTTGGRPWTKTSVTRLLNNRKYLGQVGHYGETFEGEHDAIVEKPLWDKAQAILAENSTVRSNNTRAQVPALLRSVIHCGHCDAAMTPTSTIKKARTYRFYRCSAAARNGHGTCPVRSVAAGQIEEAVVGQLRAVFRTPELVARTYREAKSREREETDRLRGDKAELEKRLVELKQAADRLLKADGNGAGSLAEELRRAGDDMDDVKTRMDGVVADLQTLESGQLSEREVIDALTALDPVWNELFPAEQTRILQLLVEHVVVRLDGLEISLRVEGMASLVEDLRLHEGAKRQAA